MRLEDLRESGGVSNASLALFDLRGHGAGRDFFLSADAMAQDWAKPRLNNSPRHGEWVDYKSGERTLKAFVVYPERKEKAPVVLVIHEIFGMTDWVRGVCDQLAENGVIAIAPDLLSGQTYPDVDGARKAIAALPKEQVIADLNATAEYALKIPAGNGNLAVCGFCWGGGWAFDYATMNPKLKAAYSFYGPIPEDPAGFAKIACPVYGFYGEKDERVNAGIPKARGSDESRRQEIRARHLQRRRARFHARGRIARRFGGRQEGARRCVGALEDTAEGAVENRPINRDEFSPHRLPSGPHRRSHLPSSPVGSGLPSSSTNTSAEHRKPGARNRRRATPSPV